MFCENKNMIWYDMIWYDMIWYDMIWFNFWKVVKNPPKCLCQSHTILSCEKKKKNKH